MVLKKLGIKNLKDEVEMILTAEDKNSINFEKTVRKMGSLNPKIKLMTKL